MAHLSHSKQLERLSRMGRTIGDLRRQKRLLEIRIDRETRRMIIAGHSAGLNNAEIARLIGGVTAEAVRLWAEAAGSVNPRAIKKHKRATAPRADHPPLDPS